MYSKASARNSNNYCSVFGCKSFRSKEVSLHLFPRDPVMRKTWETVLCMGKKATKTSCVCSLHFHRDNVFLPDNPCNKRRLKRNAVPTKNLPQRSHQTILTSQASLAQQSRKRRLEVRALKRERNDKSAVEESMQNLEVGMLKECPVAPAQDVWEEDEAALTLLQLHYQDTEKMNHNERKKDAAVQVDGFSMREAFKLPHLLKTEKDLQLFTGLSSFALLDTIVEMITEISMENNTERDLLSPRDKIILVLCKLKLNLTYECLACLFSVSADCCSHQFRITVQLLSEVMNAVSIWPTREQISKNLPTCFKPFPQTRVVLDCFEIFVEKTKCLTCKISTYSHYKGTNTVKVLVGIAPSGMITHISNGFGGRASDKAITLQSGILDKCEPGDGIMVDKGFMIEQECLVRGLKLIRPPFLGSKNRLSKEECVMNADIAAARVHVERSIQRLRQLKILCSRLSYPLLPYVDSILKVAAGLVNLGKPILGTKRFV